MSTELFGNVKGLAPSELRALRKLGQRRVGVDEIVSLDLAREIFQLASQLRRRIGLLLSREGAVEQVCIGTKEILYLPDLGRYRLGNARLRRLRLVYSDLTNSNEPVIPNDIYGDLEKLRLDMVVSIKVAGNRTMMRYAHITPMHAAEERAVHTEYVPELSRLDLNFAAVMEAVEAELSASAPEQQRVSGKMRAVLVGVYDARDKEAAVSMAELEELARTAGVEVVEHIVQKRKPDPRTVLGKGKVEEVVLRCLRLGAELIIFDTELRPSQWRAITNSTELKVIDRSMLILDIFAQRAQSSEGRLQVELAQLKYTLPRLVEMDSGLSRLTGGIGGRGPGETKLEIGRRRTRERIVDLERKIDKLSADRGLRRRRRQENELPLVSILGYTNVGKSTLFNALTGSSVLAENKLFATLDPAQRKLFLQLPAKQEDGVEVPVSSEVILSDTVGFIRRLPDELVNAFRATLEELHEAQLLVHVIDASDPEASNRKEAVDEILRQMKLETFPTLVVVNKIDAADQATVTELVRDYDAVPVSAKSKQGFAELMTRIELELRKSEATEKSVSEETFSHA